ncbi:MAG TPA: ribosomal protein S18-alanine N-acetyltransferase [Capillibacterium sp.]
MYKVEPMTIDDLPEVLAIEEESFPIPWSRSSFLYELLENERAYYCVAKAEGKVLGFVGMWIIFDEGHITNLAVASTHRRHGVGRALLQHLVTEAKIRGLRYLTLEVRASNYAAQRLYEEFGFVKTGVRPRYYQDNQEDAYIMWKGPM